MLLKRDDIKDVCSKILAAVDTNGLSTITETLELIVQDDILYLNVTNREYFAQVKLPVTGDNGFHATVNASLFLKLIPQITTDTIELNIKDNLLIVKGNGTYKLPLIYEGSNLLELPKIDIDNVTAEFDVNSDILISILNYNSKELNKGTIMKPVQKLFYVDEFGCITFTSGACVNNFTLPKPIKILLKHNIVKLFKLFKGSTVHFTLGQDAISEDITQTKVKFECGNITLTAILSCDDSLINSVPVNVIRNMATDGYPYSVVLNKELVLQTINRLLLFGSNRTYANFNFGQDSLEISFNNSSKEVINYCNGTNINNTYSSTIDLIDLKLTIENCSEEYITLNFGNSRSVVVIRNNIYNVIPEVMEQ